VSLSAQLRQEAGPAWDAQHAHPFVRGIADGTLPEEAFRFYIRQDHRFLVDYGRLLALAAARAPRLTWMRRFSALAQSVLEVEMELQRELAAEWGITEIGMEQEPAAPATAAYCDFLLRTAALGDFAELVAALLPCMWGYAEVGERLSAAPRPKHEGYAAWIDLYAGEEFSRLAAWCRQVVDEVGATVSGEAVRRMHAAFRTSTEHELAFWDAAWAARPTGRRRGA
jgi:thiaminase/transcriptional activator TenA